MFTKNICEFSGDWARLLKENINEKNDQKIYNKKDIKAVN
jgi:hypothetical protein